MRTWTPYSPIDYRLALPPVRILRALRRFRGDWLDVRDLFEVVLDVRGDRAHRQGAERNALSKALERLLRGGLIARRSTRRYLATAGHGPNTYSVQITAAGLRDLEQRLASDMTVLWEPARPGSELCRWWEPTCG